MVIKQSVKNYTEAIVSMGGTELRRERLPTRPAQSLTIAIQPAAPGGFPGTPGPFSPR